MLKEYCQSCGRLMQRKPDFGTEKNGTLSRSFCRKCYIKGEFIEPALTRWQMIERLVPKEMRSKRISYIEALISTNKLLSGLERWRARQFWN